MIEGKPSHTAIHVAATRAAHLRFDQPPHLLEDRCAEDLLGPDYLTMIESLNDAAHWVLRENRLFVPLRARWVEDRLLEAYARGTRRYMILGAGLDSFAFRQPEGLEDLEIIEVDHPATQHWKLERIRTLGWPKPDNLHFVECDFEQTKVSEVLANQGIRGGDAALVSWMGVIYYLQRPTARAALAELEGMLGAGSEVLLDYLHPYADLAARYLELEQTSGQYLKRVGEPHVNKLRPSELEADILQAGFSRALLVSRADLEARYLTNVAIEVPLSERFGLAIARK